MLRLEHINTGYDKRQVLFDVSLEVNRGDVALLVGSNGSGKSTLLKTVYGQCRVWSGKVFFEGEDITNLPPHKLLRKGIVYAPQKNNVFEQLTVKENLEISGLTLKGRGLFKERYAQVLEQFQVLKPFLKAFPMKMSGGERQQLVLAMALMHQPKLLMIDEPFTGLSPQGIMLISNALIQLRDIFSVTILMVEHRVK